MDKASLPKPGKRGPHRRFRELLGHNSGHGMPHPEASLEKARPGAVTPRRAVAADPDSWERGRLGGCQPVRQCYAETKVPMAPRIGRLLNISPVGHAQMKYASVQGNTEASGEAVIEGDRCRSCRINQIGDE